MAISVEGVHKRYGDKQALAGLDLEVARGTVHAVLGPNGAGKTTAVRIMSTLLRHDEGAVRVAGHDVTADPAAVRARIGLLGQHAALDEELAGRQNLEMFGRLHHLGARRAGRRADELLERFGLADTGRKAVKRYSGGMRRRLDLAASLITDPEVLFLDEPTTGLDPRGRAEVWGAVRSLVGGGTTVLLTTQYLEEADRLADRIALIDGGRVAAEGTADELKALVGADRIVVVLRDAARLAEAARLLPDPSVDPDTLTLSFPVADRMAGLARTLRTLEEAGVEAADLAVRRPTLDEVFLHLTDREEVAA
ncbi:daunorubicin resistance protein DrrA family ABC transporter ATP-binding protein [Streptomyces nojiriensis]|uniref:Daunorubicin resistance protein DrrA family ABC transporter ATP-binding protein n=1 Tax=Streptomyces nojiriensis TaxID=66374 RepID=A0ABQ3SZ91_9ACTN|nr:ATP-binding cassette domain-containing protein [Streptomyces nojiriensis]QTI46965.1 Daunorubicin/doxorubicin resistance ATP-binding protein DrrA [Streptomyces nojiriensis]GGS18903.1 daunorubicin resistance protein DrrA family ABC transporter ATP-binding protein [Streptomyces nojiriensis]GHI73454.1 daunorubicin resistance protein DrrA family ABC transporter ATP-binding protein [Streptomyces nojiriensis]